MLDFCLGKQKNVSWGCDTCVCFFLLRENMFHGYATLVFRLRVSIENTFHGESAFVFLLTCVKKNNVSSASSQSFCLYFVEWKYVSLVCHDA